MEAAKAVVKSLEARLAGAHAQVAQKEELYRVAQRRAAGKAEVGAPALAVANRFKYRVPIEIGATEFKEGGRIDILEIWGTRPRIEVGGHYVVRGKYMLPSHEHGALYFFRTATDGNGFGPILDLQNMKVPKGEGEFTLMHTMEGRAISLVLTGPDYRATVADVYFAPVRTCGKKS